MDPDLPLWPRLLRQAESPPVWTLASIALIAGMARGFPLLPPGPVLRGLGLAAILMAAFLFAAAVWSFVQARTTILPRETPGRLITGGVYRFSRNSIYLADVLIVTGVALRWDLAGLGVAAALALLLQRRFIRGEEAGCRAAFGPAWDAYAARVRRWL
jgi:protein-S-isoprenylcysteine O-methyltransferase Ste14